MFNKNPLRDASMELQLDFPDVIELNKFLSSGIQKIYFIETCDSRLEIFRLLNIFKRLENNGFNSDYLGPNNAALLNWKTLKRILGFDKTTPPIEENTKKQNYAYYLGPGNAFSFNLDTLKPIVKRSVPTLKPLTIIDAQDFKKQDDNFRFTLKSLFMALSNDDSKKAIVVCFDHFCFKCIHFEQKVLYHSEFSVNKSVDEIGFKDLTEDCQRFFLDLKTVYFLDTLLSLEQFMLIFGGEIGNIISAQVLKDITFDSTIPNHFIKIGNAKKNTEEEVNFFVQITFYNKFLISKQIKRILGNNLISDRFIFSNVGSVNQLTNILKLKRKNKKKVLQNKHIFTFENIEEAKCFYDKDKCGSLHVINYDNIFDEFNWISSKNSLINIRKFIVRNHKNAITLSNLLDCKEPKKSVILYGPSGSGKTYILSKIQSLLPTSWVIYVDLVKHKRDILKIKNEVDHHSVIEFLSSCIEPHLLACGLLNQYLFHKSELSVYILFDSFDQVARQFQLDKRSYNILLNLFSFLKNQSQAHIWIASSLDQYTQNLENILCEFRTIFATYQLNDSIKEVYLKNKKAIHRCSPFTGLPLALNMLSHDCIEISEYIKRKFDIYMGTYFLDSNFKQDIVKYLYAIHGLAAAKIVYPKLTLLLGSNKDNFRINISTVGFVSDTSNLYNENNYRFENLIFADFFIAIDIFYKWMTNPETCSLEPFLVFDILLKPEYKNIRFFLNSYINHNPLPPAPEVVSQRLAQMWNESKRNFFNDFGKCAFHILIEEHLELLAKWFFDGDFFNFFFPIIISTNKLYEKLQNYNQTPNYNIKPFNDIMLFNSIRNNQIYEVKLLNDSGNIPNPFALHLAASLGFDEITEFLTNCNIPVDILDNKGQTPLYYAFRNNHMNIINLLIAKGAVLTSVDKLIKKLICHCAQHNYIEQAKILINNSLESINSTDKRSMSPLIYAAKSKNLDMAILLLNKGADINHIDDYGISALCWAVLVGDVQMVDLLMGAGADYNIKLNDGSNLLHIAVKNNSLNMVKYLCFCSIDFNMPNFQGITPLEYATRFELWDIVKHLVLEGALTIGGFNPITAIVDKTQWQLVSFLISKGCSLSKESKQKQLEVFKQLNCSTPIQLIKLGNTELLELFLEKNNNKTLAEIDQSLSEPYEELRLVGVELSENMKSFIEEKLVEIRSSIGQIFRLSSEGTKNRKHLVLEQIDILLEQYSSANVDNEFIARAMFVAQNIEILKRGRRKRIKEEKENSNIPWEQTEFCIIIFINFFLNTRDEDFEFRLVLDQDRLLMHLQCFSKTLQSTDIELIQDDDLMRLETDYRILKDIYSLQRISKYIKLAISLDTNEEINIFALMRTLQVVGEYLKNTKDSLNLSHEIIDYLLRFAPINIQNILTTLRDAMLHPTRSKRDIEDCLRNNKNYFDSILNELRKVRLQTDFLLYKKKSESLKVFHQKCAAAKDLEVVKRYLPHNAESEITKEDYEIRDLMDIKVLINTLKQALPERDINGLLTELSKEIKKNEETVYKKLNKTKEKYLDYRQFYNNTESLPISYMEEQLRLLNIRTCNEQREGIYNKACNIVIDLQKKLQANSDGCKDNAIKICSQLIHMMKWGFHKANTIQDIHDNLSNNDELIDSSLEYVFKQIIIFLDEDQDKETVIRHLAQNKVLHENLCDLKKCHEGVLNIIRKLSITKEETINLERNIINRIQFNKFLDKIRSTTDLSTLETEYANFLKIYENLCITKTERKFFKTSFSEGVGNLDKYAKLIKNFKNDKFYDNLFEFCSILNNELINLAVRNYIQKTKDSFINECLYKLDLLSNIVMRNKKEILSSSVYQAAIESLLLDVMTGLKTSQSIIEYDLSYDENVPLLVGNSLRNYLAHGTPLIDIMPYDPINAILSTIRVIQNNMFKKAPDAKMYNNDCLISHFKKLLAFTKLSEHGETLNSSKPLYFEYFESAALNDLNNIKHISNTIMGTSFNYSILIWPALIVAVKNGHLNIVETLFQSIKNIKISNNISYESFQKAASYLQGYSVNLNRSLWDENKKEILPRCREFYLNVALREAVKSGNCEIVELLLQDCNSINFVDGNNITLLHLAAKKGNDKIVKALLKRKIHIDALTKSLITPLHMAAIEGHSIIVEILLNNGANVNAQNIEGMSALHYAADSGYDQVTETLLKHNALIDLESKIGTSLHLSVKNKHVNTAKILLEHGADVNKADSKGSTSLEIAAANGCLKLVKLLLTFKATIQTGEDNFTPLLAASFNSRHEIVKLILDERPDLNVNHYFRGTVNALQLAVMVGNIQTIQILLDHGANISLANKQGITALDIACLQNQTKIVKHFLNSIADLNEFSCLVAKCLYLAASHGHHEIVEELLKRKAEVINYKEPEVVLTSLHIAALNGHLETVNILLKYNANIDEKSNDESRAIHFAASTGNSDIVKTLIEHGAEVNVQTEILFTPLHLAAQNDHIEVATILLYHQADVNAVANDNRTTPLGIAVQQGHAKMAKILIEKGANTRFPGNSTPAIHQAIIHHREEVIKMLLNLDSTYAEITSIRDGNTPLYIASGCGYLEAVDILLKYNVNVNAAMNNGTTALHFASQEGHEKIVAKLLEHKADVRARSKLKYTPLHMAADNGRKRVVIMLLENNANIEDTCFRGATALHCSAEEGRTEVVKILLDTNAKVNVAMNNGSTPLHLASVNGHIDVVKILLDYKADVNMAKEDQSTAIHLATENNRLDIVKTLLERGARVNDFRKTTEAVCETPLDIAEKKNLKSIAAVLKEKGARRYQQLQFTHLHHK
ncbi:uncharacterized protein LOC126740776 isoform X2 [Anthonomus grandis grandis]|nr:uncharacterized protein LOC126740776 isoform X2 [Anthonomus grandis grandis]